MQSILKRSQDLLLPFILLTNSFSNIFPCHLCMRNAFYESKVQAIQGLHQAYPRNSKFYHAFYWFKLLYHIFFTCSRPTRWRGDRSFLLIWYSCCSSALHTWIIFLSFLSICSSKILVLSRKNHLLFIQLIVYFLIWSWFFFTCIRKASSPKANELENKSNKIITSHTAFRKQWFSFLMNLLKRIRLLCNSSDFYQYRMWS